MSRKMAKGLMNFQFNLTFNFVIKTNLLLVLRDVYSPRRCDVISEVDSMTPCLT